MMSRLLSGTRRNGITVVDQGVDANVSGHTRKGEHVPSNDRGQRGTGPTVTSLPKLYGIGHVSIND